MNFAFRSQIPVPVLKPPIKIYWNNLKGDTCFIQRSGRISITLFFLYDYKLFHETFAPTQEYGGSVVAVSAFQVVGDDFIHSHTTFTIRKYHECITTSTL